MKLVNRTFNCKISEFSASYDAPDAFEAAKEAIKDFLIEYPDCRHLNTIQVELESEGLACRSLEMFVPPFLPERSIREFNCKIEKHAITFSGLYEAPTKAEAANKAALDFVKKHPNYGHLNVIDVEIDGRLYQTSISEKDKMRTFEYRVLDTNKASILGFASCEATNISDAAKKAAKDFLRKYPSYSDLETLRIEFKGIKVGNIVAIVKPRSLLSDSDAHTYNCKINVNKKNSTINFNGFYVASNRTEAAYKAVEDFLNEHPNCRYLQVLPVEFDSGYLLHIPTSKEDKSQQRFNCKINVNKKNSTINFRCSYEASTRIEAAKKAAKDFLQEHPYFRRLDILHVEFDDDDAYGENVEVGTIENLEPLVPTSELEIREFDLHVDSDINYTILKLLCPDLPIRTGFTYKVYYYFDTQKGAPTKVFGEGTKTELSKSLYTM